MAVAKGVPGAGFAALVNLKSFCMVVAVADVVLLVAVVRVVLFDLAVGRLPDQEAIEEDCSQEDECSLN